MADKVTKMVLKVDLQCRRCYKKIKKILQKFPEIGDQMFNEKENTVTITVDSYNPEKIRQKLCCKGVGIIKSVDIIEPPRSAIPNPPLKLETAGAYGTTKLGGQVEDVDMPPLRPPTEKKKKPDERKSPERRLGGQVEDLDIPPVRPPPEKKKVPDEPRRRPRPLEPSRPEKPTESPEPILVPGYPPFYPIGVIGVCCGPWPDSYGGGPCRYHGHGRPPPCYDGCGGSRPTPPCYDRCGCSCGSGCGRRCPCYDGCGCGCGGTTVFVNRCDQYLCEENPSACTVM